VNRLIEECGERRCRQAPAELVAAVTQRLALAGASNEKDAAASSKSVGACRGGQDEWSGAIRAWRGIAPLSGDFNGLAVAEFGDEDVSVEASVCKLRSIRRRGCPSRASSADF